MVIPILYKVAIVKDSFMSVSWVSWSRDGNPIGVVSTTHFVHLYAYQAHSDLQQQLKIATRVGGVKDLAMNCIESVGVDFNFLGVDPHVLAAYRESNKGLIPFGLAEASVRSKHAQHLIRKLVFL